MTAHEMPPLWGFIFLNPTNWDSEAKEEDGKVCAFQTVTLLKAMVYLEQNINSNLHVWVR